MLRKLDLYKDLEGHCTICEPGIVPHITTLVEKWFMLSAAIGVQKILLTHLPEGSTYRV